MEHPNASLSAQRLDYVYRIYNTNILPDTLTGTMLGLTERLRQRVLMPASEQIKSGQLTAERKETDGMRGGDAKTITVETDHVAEDMLIEMQRKAFPDAYIIGEEMFGKATAAEKIALLDKALKHKGRVIINDSLDGTRPFTQGKDGFGTMVTVIENGDVVGAFVHYSKRDYKKDGIGYTLSWEKGDVARVDGHEIKPLRDQKFSGDAKMLRGYAGFEFLKGTDALRAAFALPVGAPLANQFDSLSDLWTCGTLYRDMLEGKHHFMIVPPPVDIFDYPMGIALLEQAGGVARFADGTRATLAEIVKRQGFEKPSFDPKNPNDTVKYLTDPAHYRAPENALILAVSEDAFKAVQGVFQKQFLDKRRSPDATRMALAQVKPLPAFDKAELAKAQAVLDMFSGRLIYVSGPTLQWHNLDEDKARIAYHVERAKKKGGVMAPALFDDTLFAFTPDQRNAFLDAVLNDKSAVLSLTDGWENDASCVRDYLQALTMQAGRAGRNDIDIVNQGGIRITVAGALGDIRRSVERDMKTRQDPEMQERMRQFLSLYDVTQQLRADVYGRRTGDTKHKAHSKKLFTGAEVDDLFWEQIIGAALVRKVSKIVGDVAPRPRADGDDDFNYLDLKRSRVTAAQPG